jgi:hypothetical protein
VGVKKVRINRSELRQLLGVPDELELVDVTIKRDPWLLYVYVRGDKLPEVSEYAEAPIADLEIWTDDNGQVYTEWDI